MKKKKDLLILLSSRHYVGFSKIVFDKIAKIFNSKIFFFENLDIDLIENINNFKLIYTRHYDLFKYDFFKKIRTNILIQDEKIAHYSSNFLKDVEIHNIKLLHKSNVFFYTDSYYLSLGEKLIRGKVPLLDQFKKKQKKIVKKDIDILLIASSRNKRNKNKFLDVIYIFFAFKYLNFFGNLYSQIKQDLFFNLIFLKKKNFFFHYNNIHFKIRYLRRIFLVNKLEKLSKKFNVEIYGYKNNKFKKDNFLFKDRLELEDFDEVFSRSKIVICTTPLAGEINERINLILTNYDCIPFCEPYKQNIFDNEIQKKFTYKYDKSFKKKIIYLIENYNEEKKNVEKISEIFKSQNSDEEFKKHFQRLFKE